MKPLDRALQPPLPDHENDSGRGGCTPLVGALCAADFRPPPAVGPARVLVFGGSFDPPHVGHAAMLEAAMLYGQDSFANACPFDLTLIVPAAQSPHKAHSPRASDLDRVALCRLGLLGADSAARWNGGRGWVWTDELEQTHAAISEGGRGEPAPPSYTYDTVMRIIGWMGRAETIIYLLLGGDQAAAFHRWHRAKELLALVQPLVYTREGGAAGDGMAVRPVNKRGTPRSQVTLKQGGAGGKRSASSEGYVGVLEQLRAAKESDGRRYWSGPELKKWRAGMLSGPPINVSSSNIREALAKRAAARPALEAFVGLHPVAAAFIEKRGLYRG